MGHVLFALIDRPARVATTLVALDALGARDRGFTVVRHTGDLESSTEENPLSDTHAASAAIKGALFGTIFGALAGALLAGPLGLAGGPLVTLAFTSIIGGAFGTAIGAVAGSTDVDPTLGAMARNKPPGSVLLSVDAESLSSVEEAEKCLVRHGARVVHRRLLRRRKR